MRQWYRYSKPNPATPIFYLSWMTEDNQRTDFHLLKYIWLTSKNDLHNLLLNLNNVHEGVLVRDYPYLGLTGMFLT